MESLTSSVMAEDLQTHSSALQPIKSAKKKDPGDNGIRNEDSNTRQHSSANQICEKKSRLTRGSAAKSSRT